MQEVCEDEGFADRVHLATHTVASFSAMDQTFWVWLGLGLQT